MIKIFNLSIGFLFALKTRNLGKGHAQLLLVEQQRWPQAERIQSYPKLRKSLVFGKIYKVSAPTYLKFQLG